MKNVAQRSEGPPHSAKSIDHRAIVALFPPKHPHRNTVPWLMNLWWSRAVKKQAKTSLNRLKPQTHQLRNLELHRWVFSSFIVQFCSVRSNSSCSLIDTRDPSLNSARKVTWALNFSKYLWFQVYSGVLYGVVEWCKRGGKCVDEGWLAFDGTTCCIKREAITATLLESFCLSKSLLLWKQRLLLIVLNCF